MTQPVCPATSNRSLTLDEVEDAFNASTMYAAKGLDSWNVRPDFASALCLLALKALRSESAPQVVQMPSGPVEVRPVIDNGDGSYSSMPSAIEQKPADTNEYFGKDCPKGMVQVEFVGVDPKLKRGEYGWKPSPHAFLDIYVDGQRFNIQVGDMDPYGHEGKRGLHVNYPIPAEVENRCVNALTILLPEDK